MNARQTVCCLFVALACWSSWSSWSSWSTSWGAEPPSSPLPPFEQAPLSRDDVTPDRLRAAIASAVPLIQKAAMGSAKQRRCFTCHHQAMPMLALANVRAAELPIDEHVLTAQTEHTERHLQRGYRNYQKGKGQGGRITTAGYLLRALEAAGVPPNEQTAAAAGYLLGAEKDAHWKQSSARPPTSGSDFANTYLAVRAIETYGDEATKSRWRERLPDVKQWALNTKPQHQEDRVFRLRLAETLHVPADVRAGLEQDLLQQQRFDGGWAQAAGMQSDAYATATATVALLSTTGSTNSMSHDEARSKAAGRGLAWLLQHQRRDGSWHVRTRAQGFQTYFETGFPHGKDQFISASASCWAVLAMTRALTD